MMGASKWLSLLLLASVSVSPAWAKEARKETRREILASCVAQAKDKSLVGDAYAEYMRGCLKKPDDAKEQAYAASEPQKVTSGTKVQPDMVQPTDKGDKGGKGASKARQPG